MIYFSVCKYIPDLIRGESINIGLVVHYPHEERSEFIKPKNWKRISSFDDELDYDILKAVLENMEHQLTIKGTKNDKDIGTIKDAFLKKHLAFYVNNFQFGEILPLRTDNVKKEVSDLWDMYLYYEKPKNERISQDRVRALTRKIFNQYNIRENYKYIPDYENIFHQKPFDFTLRLRSKEVFIKALSFDYKQPERLLKEVKSVLFDIEEARQLGYEDIKIVINNTEFETDYEKMIYEILVKQKNIQVLTLSQLTDLITSGDAETGGNEQMSFLDM